MVARICAALVLVAFCSPAAQSLELPWWVDSVSVSPPGLGGLGAVTLEGTWIDTGAPDAISHTILNGALHFTVSAPDLNVGTGDALTPWTLTEEFGPLDPTINELTGSIFSVDPNNRGIRQHVSGPDFLGWIYPPPQGEFHGLGSLNSPAYVSAAYDVSADGRVVTGHNQLAPNAAGFITREAFAWSPSTGMISLGLLEGGSPGGSTGRGVSADGNYIVGGSSRRDSNSIQTQEAFRWSLGGGMEPLGTIHGISSTSEARAVSRNGRVTVGVDEFYPPTMGPEGAPIPIGSFRRAFRHTDEGGMQDLGTLPEYSYGSSTEAVDVSASGRVIAGTAYRNPYLEATPDEAIFRDLAQPFLWTEESGMKGLGNPDHILPAVAIYPPPQQETVAAAVSADGKTVVATDQLVWQLNVDPVSQYPYEQAVMWRDGQWRQLGRFSLPPGPEFVGSTATDVSAEGDTVIGQALLVATDATTPGLDPLLLEGDPDGFGRIQVPFIWDVERGMRPLARVLAGDYGLDLEGWRLNQATAISDDGTTIVGVGVNPEGVQEAWRAVMHRNIRPGDADFDGDVDRDDRATLDANLGMTSADGEVYWSFGDFDQDGAVGASDMQMLIAHYDGRSLGDFNADGVVDAADYTVWRDNVGQASGVADSNGDGLANHDDLEIWQANYGRTLEQIAAAQAAPEPTAVALGLLMAGGLASVRRRG